MIWDGRAYLIPEDLMLTFCERFRSGWRGEGIDGACWFAFRRASSSRAVLPALAGALPVPGEAVKYLSLPFSARVLTATSGDGRYGTVYRIDRGAQDALAFGSLLTSATGGAYRVISVDPTEATIAATGGISNDGVGTVLSPL